MSELYHINDVLASQYLVFLCLPTAGITSEDIQTCFGGFVGIGYDYSDSVHIGGNLSYNPCRKHGKGTHGKYLATSLQKKKCYFPLRIQSGHRHYFFPIINSILVNGETA